MHNVKRISKIVVGIFISILILSACTHSAQAATLSLIASSDSDHYVVGKPFSVTVLVDTKPGQNINAIAGTVNFPSDKVELLSVDKSNSIIDYWVSNANNEVAKASSHFEGVTSPSGFTGIGGDIIVLQFKAKAAGPVKLSLSTASVLANDGQGTNVLDALNSTDIDIEASPSQAVTPPVITPVVTPIVPVAPVVQTPVAPVVQKAPVPMTPTSDTNLDFMKTFVGIMLNYILLVTIAITAVIFSIAWIWFLIYILSLLRRKLLERIKQTESPIPATKKPARAKANNSNKNQKGNQGEWVK